MVAAEIVEPMDDDITTELDPNPWEVLKANSQEEARHLLKFSQCDPKIIDRYG